ncbi:MAG TPA: ATP citrate lyase citrate-binding domain-containing protein, partial [bacterium]|nr:ATP citrate lyase citrate-binding domain-containing protein [bacterium]
ASGGGTSVEALDNLCLLGGKPAVFTEYSGNPSAEKVKGLTRIALMTEQPIDGLWVIGGRANFTDIYETIVSGFLEGVRETPNFDRTIPIVVRRAGPRDEEAFRTLRKAREEEGYNILVRGMGTSVSESARMMINQARKHEQSRLQGKS